MSNAEKELEQEMREINLWRELRGNIPKDWRIGQFIFNFLEWLGQKGYAPLTWSSRMGDPFNINDDKFIEYWQEYLQEGEVK